MTRTRENHNAPRGPSACRRCGHLPHEYMAAANDDGSMCGCQNHPRSAPEPAPAAPETERGTR